MIELALAKAKELLAEAVALKGEDYVYTTPDGKQGSEDWQPRCLYVHGEQPGCIVGHVLHAASVSLPVLSAEETNDAEGAVRNLAREDVLSYEDGVSRLLQDVQAAQDRGIPWGQALREALAELEN